MTTAKIAAEKATFLAANPAIAKALTTLGDPVHARNSFAHDVLNKLDRYGSLSERQVVTVLQSLARDVEFAAVRAAEATEVKGPAPVGRATVTGKVLSTKMQDGHYGVTKKMLVKLENNSKVWMTAPSRATIERGDTITVSATFTVSKDDVSFAFGSRPQLVNRIAA